MAKKRASVVVAEADADNTVDNINEQPWNPVMVVGIASCVLIFLIGVLFHLGSKGKGNRSSQEMESWARYASMQGLQSSGSDAGEGLWSTPMVPLVVALAAVACFIGFLYRCYLHCHRGKEQEDATNRLYMILFGLCGAFAVFFFVNQRLTPPKPVEKVSFASLKYWKGLEVWQKAGIGGLSVLGLFGGAARCGFWGHGHNRHHHHHKKKK